MLAASPVVTGIGFCAFGALIVALGVSYLVRPDTVERVYVGIRGPRSASFSTRCWDRIRASLLILVGLLIILVGVAAFFADA